MFALGARVKVDENGWLVEAAEWEEAIGVVCGEPNYETSSINVSLSSYPHTIQHLLFEQVAWNVKEARTLASLWAEYVGHKPKRKIRLLRAD